MVLALNAWMARAFPQFERSVAIVSSDMLITEPRPDLLQEIGLTSGVSVLDSRIFVHYYHNTPDGRLMLGKGGNTFAYGGRMLPVFDRPSPYLGQLRGSLREFFPEFAEVAIEASWNGPSDRSVTGLPFFGRLDGRDNVFYGFGYSGSGVGPCHMGGQILSSLALGLDNPWTRSPLTQGPLGRFPPEPIRYVGSLMVRNAIRRRSTPKTPAGARVIFDVRLARFSRRRGQGRQGVEPLSGRLFSPFWGALLSFSVSISAQAKVVKAHLIHPSACARLFQPLAQFSFMHLPTTRTLPYQPSANPAGTPARLPGKHSRWLELEPLALPLELAFWALWHCRHARPPDARHA